MVKYIILCKQPSKPKITISNHLIDSSLINSYSLSDLQDLAGLKKILTDFHSELVEHITKNCEVSREIILPIILTDSIPAYAMDLRV